MTREETQKVRLAARSLFHRLREMAPPVLVQDWFRDGQSRSRVKTAVEEVLDHELPPTYDRAIFAEKCNRVFETILAYASKGEKWAA
jgi:type I restriction enzyme R subunit